MEPVETPQEQSKESFEGVAIAEEPKRDWLKIVLFSLTGLLILSGAVYGGYWYATQTVQKPLVEAPTPSPTPQPTPIPEAIPTLPPTPTPPVKTINYRYIKDWKTYQSSQGFSFQYPDGFRDFHQARADETPLGSVEGDFCEISSFRKTSEPEFPGQGESLSFHVVPYPGGSRRQLLIYNLRLTKSKLISTKEISVSGVNGLEMSFVPQYPSSGEILHTAILVKGDTALIIGFYQLESNDQEWYSLLASLKISPDFELDLSKCKSDR